MILSIPDGSGVGVTVGRFTGVWGLVVLGIGVVVAVGTAAGEAVVAGRFCVEPVLGAGVGVAVGAADG
ncbi:MAG: hypothetical protein H0W34_09585 [Pyrinomonadaceae bacterium]|nr:hypothetical protein [Pyrinomonadaceae bacterium]MBA3568509.1 hypothetical protein [Pyrinomonadaceae bacterium]MBA3572207.1 hypothetical protein [Pyrinomonadaceae bacterium]MDQ3173665.1 hypothetical protein [Acidobacteriota bacterium]